MKEETKISSPVLNVALVKELAKDKGIALSEVCEYAGITTQGLHRSVRENSINAATLMKFSEFFGVPIAVFFGEETKVDRKVYIEDRIEDQGREIDQVKEELEEIRKEIKELKSRKEGVE